jgi:type VI secretion system secreted protein Hcp
MAFDAFMKIDGITGDSTDKAHPGEIEVMSYSFGVANSARAVTGSGGGAGRASFQDLHFTAGLSKASPQLFLKCVTGVHIPHCTLTVRKAGETPIDFFIVKLSNTIIGSYSDAFGNDDLPVDSVSLVFGAIQIEYKSQKADGGIGSVISAGWDLQRNRQA